MTEPERKPYVVDFHGRKVIQFFTEEEAKDQKAEPVKIPPQEEQPE